jgi:hypothetical protein
MSTLKIFLFFKINFYRAKLFGSMKEKVIAFSFN